MSSLSNYWRARGYAYRLVGTATYPDLVHDAYVLWFDKTGQNLFEQDSRLVTKVIKNIFLGRSKKNMFMWNGQWYPKKNMRILEDSRYVDEGGTDFEVNGYVARSTENPENDLIVKDWVEKIQQTLTAYQKEILSKFSQGYKHSEIAEQKGTYPQLISSNFTHVKKKIQRVMNPIAGSKVRIIERMNVKKFKTLSGYVDTKEGNETVAIYVKQEDWQKYEDTMACDGILVKLTKD